MASLTPEQRREAIGLAAQPSALSTSQLDEARSLAAAPDAGPSFEDRISGKRESASTAFGEGRFLDAAKEFLPTIGVGKSIPHNFPSLVASIGREFLGDDPAFAEGSAVGIQEMGGNLVDQLGGAATSIGEAFDKPGETIESAVGVAGEALRHPLDTLGAMGGALADQLGQMAGSPVEFAREKPLDVASMAIPSGAVRSALRTGLKKTATAGKDVITGLGGFIGRKGKGVFDEVFEATAEGAESIRKQTLDRFRNGRKDPGLVSELSREVKSGIKQVKTTLNQKWNEGIRGVVEANRGKLRHTVNSIRDEMDEELGKFGIDAKAIRAGNDDAGFMEFGSDVGADKNAVKRALNLVDGWKDTSISGLHTLKRKLRSHRAKSKLIGASDSEAAIDSIWGSVRERLSRGPDGKPTGYDLVSKQFEEGINLLEDTVSALSANSNPETVARKMLQMFKDPGALDVRKQFIEELQDATGKPLKAMVAGLESSSWVPQGSGAWAAMLSGGSVKAGLLAPEALMVIPFASPKLVGGMARTLGWGKKAIKNAEDYAAGMANMQKVLGISTSGATFGIMLKRLMDATQREQRPSRDILTTLGTSGGATPPEQ